MKEYFHHQNYIAIYLQNFFDVLGKSVISTFSAVFLFHMGVPNSRSIIQEITKESLYQS